MNDDERRALSAVQFSSALGVDDIWTPLTHHVDGLHPRAMGAVERAVSTAVDRPASKPIGLVLSGERGVGKTHLLGWIRQLVQDRGGFFFMPKLITGMGFWSGAIHGIVNRIRGADGGQLGRMIDALSERTACDKELRIRLRGTIALGRAQLDEFVELIRQFDPQETHDYDDTLRALVLYRANDRDLREIGHEFLLLEDGITESDRLAWGFRSRRRLPQQIFNDLCWLFALAGPVVLAVDQLDNVMTQAGPAGEIRLADEIAAALMSMREETVRTIIVAACIPTAWKLIREHAVNSAADRFTELELSTNMPDAGTARAIVERHLATQYDDVGFEPSQPCWPVAAQAFADPAIGHYTPRRLLQQVEQHVRQCLDLGTVEELSRFGATTGHIAPAPPPAALQSGFDAEFARLRAAADVLAPLDPATEDEQMSTLLNVALQCYVLEQGAVSAELAIDARTSVQPALHARLRRTLDEASEDEEHWSFRAIGHPNPRAVITRLRSAHLEAGIQPGVTKRHLVVIRNIAFSTGRVTTTTIDEFEAAGGVVVPICEDDLRTFSALAEMTAMTQAGFDGWLAARRPAGRSQLFARTLGAAASPAADSAPAPALGSMVVPEPATASPSICLGRNIGDKREFRIPLVLLRKHTAVFAGSGSGKTVLLRRLVEEVALHGVSSIVIDTNNDLARLGDRWPHRPDGWDDADAERAEHYLADTDVVVWTPGRQSGRPIALNPLPDFAADRGDRDERRTAVAAAVAGLLPKTGLARTHVTRGSAVLTEALTHFADNGGGELEQFIALLTDLPPQVSAIRDAPKLAGGIADELRAAMIIDPVFSGAGHRVDPGTLLTPESGKRARVSVISCVGLTDGQVETFVNQLQLALFGWIKRHPAADRPLGSLFVLDEAQSFVPAQRPAASKESTLRLAAQARKYGLGMVYATQAPKALHNTVIGNSATQFYGRLGAAVQIRAAEELARARGGSVEGLSRLDVGQFYGGTEGGAFVKTQAPMCLSYHAESALTEEEVLERASRGGE